ncbi:MAG: aspartate/glutamate racemase family protein [Epsilonproteobacteria bacterium]|nr:aspartate/glutamate racemase family protein [Campylobacterota bacterium]
MKTIGLLGGLSWESSSNYYKIINSYTNELLGAHNNAKSVMVTVNFEEVEKFRRADRWDEATEILIQACKSLENAGADFIVICTNTMHKLLPKISPYIKIPFLHIAEATANEIKKDSVKKVLLMGTKFTMQEDFYKSILEDFGIEVVIPNLENMDFIHKVIYDELCLGYVKEDSKNVFKNIINETPDIQGVILGCTEIGILIQQDDVDVRVYDTAIIHAKEAVKKAI